MCWDTWLERKAPGLMPLSGVAPSYNDLAPGLDGGWLDLEEVVLGRGFLSLVHLAPLNNTSCICPHREVQTSSCEGV